VIIGEQAGKFLNNADDNIFIGNFAGSGLISPGNNIASDNVYIGSYSGFKTTTGNRN